MATCNCGIKAATTPVTYTVRVMGEFRSEERTSKFCTDCAKAMRENGTGR